MIEVLDARPTGETLLDEALKMIAATSSPQASAPTSTTSPAAIPEHMSVNTWIDLLSGETWNLMKIGFQLKQVRERLAKGLVDKGVLRTEKRNFLLFDMATHPVADARTKEGIVRRVTTLLNAQTRAIPPGCLGKEGEQCRVTRIVVLCCAAYAASVLDNCFSRLGYEEREAAFARAEDILAEFTAWPFGTASGSGAITIRRREAGCWTVPYRRWSDNCRHQRHGARDSHLRLECCLDDVPGRDGPTCISILSPRLTTDCHLRRRQPQRHTRR